MKNCIKNPNRAKYLQRNCNLVRSFSITTKKKWSQLSENERRAWRELGIEKSSWNDLTSLKPWNDLTIIQQAAAQNGLSFNPESWNRLVHRTAIGPSKPSSSHIISSVTPSSLSSKLAKFAWTALKVSAPLASLAKHAKGPAGLNMLAATAGVLPSIIDASSDVVEIKGIETVIYLDDSGSMSAKLMAAKGVLTSFSSFIRSYTRVIKFGTSKTVLSPRDNDWSPTLTCLSWDGTSGETFMWKMIEDDILNRYRPSRNKTMNGKLRIIVITDGYDTKSPGNYHGIKGMDPMMKTLTSKGFDIEWHIVILGNVGSSMFHSLTDKDVRRYRSLATATGGNFMVTNTLFFDAKEKYSAEFLKGIEISSENSRESRDARIRNQQKYLADVEKGKADHFEWFSMLPPPSKD